MVNNLLFYKSVHAYLYGHALTHTYTLTLTHTHTHTHTHTQRRAAFPRNHSLTEGNILFPISFATHVERFLRQRCASGCVGLELGEMMVTKPSAHEVTGCATATGKILSSVESEKMPQKRPTGNNNI